MNKEDFMRQYAAELNEQQRLAVETVDGAVLLLAVPGSGKTTVLVKRLGYMILCRGIPSGNILTLTYTRAAAGDMSKRFSNVFGEELAAQTEFRTINGICQKVLFFYGNQTGKKPFELLSDERETGRIFSEILRGILSEYPTESDIANARSEIAYCKNMMLSEKEIEKRGRTVRFPELLKVFQAYNACLKEHALIDYDDQMVYAHRILSKIPWVLAHYRNTFPYLCVDEAQDTSKIQHEIIRLLAGEKGNLFMVGDEDQSIYGFRAAFPEALLSFEKDHPGAKVLLMSTNYRSNAAIVSAADTLIRHNSVRHEKSMNASRTDALPPKQIELERRQNQYGYLLKMAKDISEETAVLYRDNESVVPLVDLLERHQIPFRIRNGDVGFFTCRVVTDIKNILLFALEPYDTELFLSIYFKFQMYLKKSLAEELCRISERKRIAVLDALEELSDIHGKVLGNCRAIRTHLSHMRKETPEKALHRIRKFMGYDEYLEQKELDDGKLFTLGLLARQENTIEGFLRRLDHLQELFRTPGERDAKLILSTIHSAKGLEYREVWMMDVCDGVFPKTAEGGKDEIEEERRLFYVGMTRAKERLNIFTFKKEKSRFVREMQQAPGTTAGDTIPVIGTEVAHRKFGKGIIVDVFCDGAKPGQIQVAFQDGQERRFSFPMVFESGNMTRLTEVRGCQDRSR